MEELSAVKRNLQGAWGEMTPGQRLRFEVIRDRFASGRWRRDALGPMPSVHSLPVPAASIGVAPSLPGRRAFPSAAKPRGIPRIRIGAIAGLTAGVYPDFSAGGMAGITLDQWGLFVKGRSNFHRRGTDFDCRSDGTTDNGYFWSGNETDRIRHQLTLDVSYAFSRPVSLYLGAGYGLRTLCWKDYSGAWARVTDRSHSGLAAEAGVLIHPIPRGPAKGLTLLLGGSWIRGGYIDAEAGLCWRF